MAPGLQLAKAASPGAPARPAAGQAVTYTLTVTNTGNQTLTEVAISDPMLGSNLPVSAWPGADGTLQPGQIARVLTPCAKPIWTLVTLLTPPRPGPNGPAVTRRRRLTT